MTTSSEQIPIVPGLSAGTTKGTDVYPGVDVTDPTQSPSGSTYAYTISQLYNFIVNAQGISTRTACRCATTANFASTYYNGPGNLGVGATLTSTSFSIMIFDGITVNVGDRILVWNQTSNVQNGIYVVTVLGDGLAINGVLARVADFNQTVNIAQYVQVLVTAGNKYQGIAFQETGAGPFTLGTTPITFAPYVL